MDVSSARMAALLKEAMTPLAVPSAKADPVKTALVKVLLQQPAPSGAPAQPITAALPVLLPATAGTTQQTGSTQILQAYLALAEPAGDRTDPAGPGMAAARRSASEGDEARRGLTVPVAKSDDGTAVRPASLPWLALLSPEVSLPRSAPAANAAASRGQATARPGDVVRSENSQISIGLMSLTVGFLAAAIVGFVLMALA